MNENYILQAHNSWSYLPIRNWWVRPFLFYKQCQEVDIKTQYNNYGVKGFDLHVRYDDDRLVIANGDIEYKCDNLFNDLIWIDSRTDCYVKVTHEVTKHNPSDIDKFKDFCDLLEENFTHIKFWGGVNHYTEEVDYYFSNYPKCKPLYREYFKKNNSIVHNSFYKMAYKDREMISIDYVNYA